MALTHPLRVVIFLMGIGLEYIVLHQVFGTVPFAFFVMRFGIPLGILWLMLKVKDEDE